MATTTYEADEQFYAQDHCFPLTITVRIGDGQGGGYLIFNGTDLVGINDHAIITRSADAAEWITITATIKDKLEETNWTSVTVELQETNKPMPTIFGPYSRELSNHLDTIIYSIKIKMKRS